MNKAQISTRHGIYMIAMFILGSSSLLVMGLEAKQDLWISILLATLFGFILFFVYGKILNFDPEKDFYQTLEFYLGKITSKVFIILIGWYCFSLANLILRNFGQFILTIGLPETPIVIAMLSLSLLCILAIKLGIDTIGYWTEIFIFLIFLFIIVGTLALIKYFDFDNLKPTLYNGFKPIIKGAFGIINFPYAEACIFLLVFPAFKKKNDSYKVFSYGLLIGSILIFITSLSDVLVLGSNIIEKTYYPTYSLYSRIQIGDFFQKLEIIASIIFVIAVFLKVTVVMLGATKCISNIFGFKEYKFLVFPVCLMILNFSTFSFNNITDFHEWVVKVFPYYTAFFTILIPVILLIMLEISYRIKSNKEKQPSNTQESIED